MIEQWASALEGRRSGTSRSPVQRLLELAEIKYSLKWPTTEVGAILGINYKQRTNSQKQKKVKSFKRKSFEVTPSCKRSREQYVGIMTTTHTRAVHERFAGNVLSIQRNNRGKDPIYRKKSRLCWRVWFTGQNCSRYIRDHFVKSMEPITQ